jgi:hypothetical protein
MDKSIKLASAIILFVFLFFITEEVTGFKGIGSRGITSIKCKTPKDCPDSEMEHNLFVAMCNSGLCIIWIQG